ncbi:MAG TPA: YeeE/YedE family protein [Vicinamibacterales bacterium]|nr:YeeE/YedE family protein [Vicinamibacterales bacterium]
MVAATAIALGTALLTTAVSARQGELFLVGVLAGLVLYHAAFGFTSAWRIFIVDRRGDALRAQMLMLALTCVVFFPALASGHFAGQAVRGSISPISIGVVVGAFMFGVGMQLGGGCASGTLYTAGGGNLRMVVTLLAFIAGSVIGAVQLAWWETLPAWKPISLVTTFGAGGGLAISLGVFAAIAALTIVVERSRHGALGPARRFGVTPHALRGPWPIVAGAIGLAAVNILTLALAGRPWGVTGAFTLWGAKILSAAGVAVERWRIYAPAARQAELHAPVIKDVTSVMDFGIMIGALFAATLAGRFAPTWRAPMRSLAAALLGGLMLGYGARIAYGCNIGAYFSGIASGSVHGWVWFPAAFAGNILGTKLRPLFGLSVR